MKGILFKPDMIKAVVEGRKTQTRRVIKPQPADAEVLKELTTVFKPRYQVGDVVYIKEAWRVYDMDTRTLREPIHRVKVEYKLDGLMTWAKMPATISYTIPDSWHSPLHMAEITARYFFTITDVRAERLQKISEADAIAEGFTETRERQGNGIHWESPRGNFVLKWDSINKPPYDWQSNPWVFVYSFELTTLEGGN